MSYEKNNFFTVVIAVLTAMAVFLSTWWLSDMAEKSKIYQQSRIIGRLASQEQLDITSIVLDGEKRDITAKFVGALTTAYINFEMIPYSEGQTFVVLMQSINEGIHVENLEYKRRDLVISGVSNTIADYNSFMEHMENSGHFSSVTGHEYLNVDGGVNFDIWCAAENTGAALLA